MKVEVGTQVRWQGHPMICTSILTQNEVRVASANSEVIKATMLAIGNIKIIQMEVGDFSEGDIVRFDLQRIELTELGKNLFHLYPYYKVSKESASGTTAVSKENTSGSSAVEGSNRTTADAAAEADRSGDQGGKGAGESSPGEDSNPLD